MPRGPTAVAGTGAPERPGTGASERQAGEHRFVLIVSAAFLGLALALSGVRVTSVVTASRSRELLNQTFASVEHHQDDYRGLNGRYATWSELAARGEQLSPGLMVVRSSATEYHWYLRIFDETSGLVCDRLHELYGDSATSARPACTEAVDE